MKTTLKRIISTALAAVMLISCCGMMTPISHADGRDLYVYIGDSMSFDYVDRFDYMESIDIYARQVARYLDDDLYEYCALPSQRTTDVYSIISDYEGDDYAKDHFDTEIADNAEYVEKLRDASVISVQIGYNGLTMYAVQNILVYFSEGRIRSSADLEQVFTDEELERSLPFAKKCVELIDSLIPDETKAAFSEYLNALNDTERAALAQLIGEDAFNTVEELKPSLDYVKDNIIYAIVSHMVHFDGMIKTIYELNPDVELYVMGLVNPLDDLSIGFELGGQSYCIELDSILSVIYDILDTYMKVLSPYSDKYYYLDNVDSIDTFGDHLYYDRDIVQKILYDIHNNESYSGYGNPNSAAYKKAVAQADGLMQALNNTRLFDVGRLIAELPEDLDGAVDALGADVCPYLDRLTEFDENGELTLSYFEQAILHINIVQTLTGIYAHPTQKAHDDEAKLLIDAIESKTVAPEAVAFHKLAAPLEEAIEKLNESDDLDSFIEWVEALSDPDSGTGFIGFRLPDFLKVIIDFIRDSFARFEKFILGMK